MADKKISQLTGAATPLAGTEELPLVQSGSTKKVAVSDLTAGRNVSLAQLTATGTTQKLGAVTLSDITVQIGPDTPVTTSSGRILFNTSSTQKNWFINHNWNLAGGLSFAQSTAAGGSTMGSDAHQWDSSGNYKIVNGNVVIGTAGKGIDFSANTGAAGMTSETLTWYEEGTWTPSQGAGLTVVGAFSSSGLYTRIGRSVTVSGTVTGSTSISIAAANSVICSNLPYSASATYVGSLVQSTFADGGTVAVSSATVYAAATVTAVPSITFTITYTV